MVGRPHSPQSRAWKWALTAAFVGGALQLLLYLLTLLAGLRDVASILQFFLVPGNIGPLLLGVVGPTSSVWAGTGLADVISVAANLLIFWGLGTWLHWLRGRSRYLYVLPLVAVIGCWGAEVYLLREISSRRLTDKGAVTVTLSPFRPGLLNDVVIGVTGREELIELLGEPACLRRDDGREILLYREERLGVRPVREKSENEIARGWGIVSDADDDATEILHVIVVSEGKVASMRTDRFELTVRDSSEFSCDLLHFDE